MSVDWDAVRAELAKAPVHYRDTLVKDLTGDPTARVPEHADAYGPAETSAHPNERVPDHVVDEVEDEVVEDEEEAGEE